MATGSAAIDMNVVSLPDLQITPTAAISLDVNAGSLVFWGYWTDTKVSQVVMTQLGGSGTSQIWLFEQSNVLKTGIGGSALAAATNLSLNAWNHMSVTFPGGTGNVKMYLDGVQDFSSSVTGTAANGDIKFSENTSSGGEWDDVGAYLIVFDKELTGDEVTELMFNPFSVTGSIWYPDLLQPSVYRDLSNDQIGNPTTSGTPIVSSNGPPVFLLCGQ